MKQKILLWVCNSRVFKIRVLLGLRASMITRLRADQGIYFKTPILDKMMKGDKQ